MRFSPSHDSRSPDLPVKKSEPLQGEAPFPYVATPPSWAAGTWPTARARLNLDGAFAQVLRAGDALFGHCVFEVEENLQRRQKLACIGIATVAPAFDGRKLLGPPVVSSLRRPSTCTGLLRHWDSIGVWLQKSWSALDGSRG